MKRHIALLTLMFAATTRGELFAQEPGGPCPYIYPAPKVGEYADLRFSSPEQPSMIIRFAIVSSEQIEGRTYYWMEVVSAPPAVGGTVVAQMLVPYYPFEQQDIKGYIVEMPGQPPRRMPQEIIDMMGAEAAPGPSWREQCAAAEDLGTEEITVAAGTFRARHFRGGDEQAGEVWIADVPFGMVKLVQPDGEMELVRYGSDARSSLHGEPVEIEFPPPPPSRR
jgi:hypothetical protein